MSSVLIRSTIIFAIHFAPIGNVSGLEPVGPRPESGIEDRAEIFREADETFLAREIRRARENHGLEVFLATYPILPSETIEERALRVRDAWARNAYTIVALYDKSLGQLGFVGSRDLNHFLSRQELESVFARAGERAAHAVHAARTQGEPVETDEVISAALTYLLRDPVLCNRATSWQAPRTAPALEGSVPLVGLVIGTVGLLAGVIAVLERRMAAQRRLGNRVSVFPKTHMSMRLGAPFSGSSGVSLVAESRS